MKISSLILFLSLVFFLKTPEPASAQVWTWDAHSPGRESNKQICRDYIGNMYLYTSQTMQNYGQTYCDTVTKITRWGQQLYKFTLPSTMKIQSMACSPDSSFYMAGTYYFTFTYAGNTFSSKKSDIWVAKYASNGSNVWVKTITGSDFNHIGDICMRGNDLVICGSLGDSITFFGQAITKQKEHQFFIASVNPAGSLQTFSCASAGPLTSTLVPGSGAWECAADPSGNIYLLTSAVGDVMYDGDTLGKWTPGNYYQDINFNLLKLNSSLQVQYVYKLGQCTQMCYGRTKELHVNSKGECFFVGDFSYGQSGNDLQRSIMYKVNPLGQLTGTFQLRPEMNSHIEDVVIDACDDIFFCGYWREEVYKKPPSPYFSPAIGCISSSLTLKALWNDSTTSNRTYPKALAITAPGELFVMGLFNDTLNLSGVLTTGSIETGFYANYNFQFAMPCALTTGLSEPKGVDEFRVAPNPAADMIRIKGGLWETYGLFDAQGRLILHGSLQSGIIDLSSISVGIYYLRLHGENSNRTEKLVVQH